MSEKNIDLLVIIVFAVVVIVLAITGASIIGAFNGQSFNEICENEYGDAWHPETEGDVLQCEHENGTRKEYPIETNLEQDHLVLPKIVFVVIAISIIVSWLLSFPKRPNE